MVKKKVGASRMKHIIVAIAIALVTVFFFSYALNVFYPSPQYEDFCERGDRADKLSGSMTQSECIAANGQWNPYLDVEPRFGNETGWCDLNYQCEKDHRAVREPYERNVFVANLVLGVIILLSAFFLGVEAVSTGLMGGGVLLIFYGTLRYWGELSDIFRTIILGVALALLIWFGYKKLK